MLSIFLNYQLRWAIMNHHKTSDQLNLKDLKAMAKWHRIDGDVSLLTTKQTLLTHDLETLQDLR